MYHSFAKYYDLIHSDLTEDIDFLVKTFSDINEPIIELGSGTGRILIPLARVGHKITGIDSNKTMLDIARLKIKSAKESTQARITMIEADMMAIDLDQQFGLAIFGQNTFMHIPSESLNQSLKSIRRHMTPGAYLFIDVDNPNQLADQADDHLLQLERSLNLPGEEGILMQSSSSWVDSVNQISHTTWIFDTFPLEGGEVRRVIARHPFHYYFPHQIELAFERTGFELADMFGDYDRSPFGDHSPRMLIIGRAV